LNAVPNGETIDLRLNGCSGGLTELPLYVSQAGIENPAAETLSYDWTYSVYGVGGSTVPGIVDEARTTTPSHNLTPLLFGFIDTDYSCTIDLRVNAPGPARSKTLRVWSGKCINLPNTPR